MILQFVAGRSWRHHATDDEIRPIKAYRRAESPNPGARPGVLSALLCLTLARSPIDPALSTHYIYRLPDTTAM